MENMSLNYFNHALTPSNKICLVPRLLRKHKNVYRLLIETKTTSCSSPRLSNYLNFNSCTLLVIWLNATHY